MRRVALAAVIVGGCAQRLAAFPTISHKKLDAVPSERGARVVAEDCVWYALFVPLGTPKLETAYARAVAPRARRGDGEWDALLDAELRARFWWALLTGKACYEVRGTLARVPRGEAPAETPGEAPKPGPPPEPALPPVAEPASPPAPTAPDAPPAEPEAAPGAEGMSPEASPPADESQKELKKKKRRRNRSSTETPP